MGKTKRKRLQSLAKSQFIEGRLKRILFCIILALLTHSSIWTPKNTDLRQIWDWFYTKKERIRNVEENMRLFRSQVLKKLLLSHFLPYFLLSSPIHFPRILRSVELKSTIAEKELVGQRKENFRMLRVN